jgi:amino acid transporter
MSEILRWIAFVLFVIFVIGIFAKWTGELYTATPWIAFACWVLSTLVGRFHFTGVTS